MTSNDFAMGLCFFVLFSSGSFLFDANPRWVYAIALGVSGALLEWFLRVGIEKRHGL